ncbi:hypothetical protein LT493_13605 [Streptomyces tricolor]|nr:hypothetical protein [Streptomyces tricolor]
MAAYHAYDPVIDVSGHMALVRYWLRVDYAPAAGRRRPASGAGAEHGRAAPERGRLAHRPPP